MPGRWPVSAQDEAARQAALVAEAALDNEALLAADGVRPEEPERVAFTADLILDQSVHAILVVDHFGDLRYANCSAAILFGYPGTEHLIDKPFRSLGFEEDDISKVENLERQACRGRDWEGTISVRRRDGVIVFVRVNAVPLRSKAGEITGTVIFAR